MNNFPEKYNSPKLTESIIEHLGIFLSVQLGGHLYIHMLYNY